ncbi:MULTISPECIES: flagellar biosynthetic protein FliR [Erwiniaceae]|uniref:Flagellar type III secretion system protein FliR n=2 Tax=Erwiniaceae TaxID=1903409 RepID=A0ACC5RGL4_ENTAG|nr:MULTISPECIES: flagellar biosynthetic protein FliR [Erwiniaceae]MBK4723774.1 flagellar type III secretion system protein FliR [Pantoea agglomerans]MBP2155127.1 flagellar biosynthetic protein FliR [Erwinia rhapontici]MCS3605463.1 flagellar biosynthetic protein FliR [Erwinia rhapontici]NKG31848.1 flagellar type III secretion system protein FliR [Erwinia rhapontici]NNS08695.1 flagellar type III secretion system protein FliR [Erwinia sp. JH02]
MILFDSSQLLFWISQLFWPLARVLALIMSAPLLNEKSISRKVKIGLGVMITWVLVPSLPPTTVTLFSVGGFWLLIQQILIGVSIGFTMQFAFAAVRTAGEVIGLQMGLSFATFFDPSSRLNMPVLARFLDMLAMLLFLSFNGHLWLISMVADSFHTLPIGGEPLNGNAFMALTKAAGLIFLNGMRLALPLITLLLTLNLALGLLNRVSPQLSVFAIGFPVTLSIGMVFISLMMPLLAPFCEHLFSEVFDLLATLLSELPGK